MSSLTTDQGYIFKPRMEESVIQTSACNSVSQRPKEVEKQLKQVSRKLAETEVNIGLFNKMAKNGVPTIGTLS